MTFDDYMRNIEAEFEQQFSGVDLSIAPLELVQLAEESDKIVYANITEELINSYDRQIEQAKRRELDLIMANAGAAKRIAELKSEVECYQFDRWMFIVFFVWAVIATAAAIHYAGVKL